MLQGVKKLCYFSGHEHGTKESLLLAALLIEGMTGKVLCCMFLLLFLGLTLNKTWQNTKRVVKWSSRGAVASWLRIRIGDKPDKLRQL